MSADEVSEAAPAPVASLDGLGSESGRVDAPVAQFDGGRLQAPAEVPVADLTGAAARQGAGRQLPVIEVPTGEFGVGRSRGRRPQLPDTGPTVSGTAPVDSVEPTRRPRRTSAAAADARQVSRPPSAELRGQGAGKELAQPADAPAAGRSAGSAQARRSAGSQPTAPHTEPIAVAKEICLRLLTERARSRHELATALHRKGVPEAVAASVLDRFGEVGLIDDATFAEQWVHSRHTGSRGLGKRALAAELRRKGVSPDDSETALSEIDTAAEERRARQLVDRKLRGATLDTPDQRAAAARRAAGMLARKGYRAGIAYQVVREALAAHGAGPDDFGSPD
jgi:regulatory protein